MSQIQTDFAGDRDQFGGDVAITSTVPKEHPTLKIPLTGTRSTVSGVGYRTFMRGDIIFKDNPSAEYNFMPWDDDGTELSRQIYMTMTIDKGFKACKVEDWILRPELAMIWSAEHGQIVSVTSTNPLRPSRAVLMYRDKDRWEQSMRSLQQVDKIVGESERKITDSISDKRVQALPTKVEVTPHEYKPSEVTVSQG